MDDILNHNIKLSLSTIIQAHSRLCVLQVHQGTFTLKDIMDTVTNSPDLHNISPVEINVYSTLLLEACALNLVSPGNFVMPRDIVANDQLFLQNLLSYIQNKSRNSFSPALEEFRREIINYLSVKLEYSNSSMMNNYNHGGFSNYNNNNYGQGYNNYNNMPQMNRKYSLYGDRNNPITRLLLQFRKNNLDILFPQSVHDKILVCIYKTLLVLGTATHNQLIDMVMEIKEYKIVGQIEKISKTKVRGVISLLKAANILNIIRNPNEHVRLNISEEVTCFEELRVKHDCYVLQFINENYLEIPPMMQGELVWMFDGEVKRKRLDLMDQLMKKVDSIIDDVQTKVASMNHDYSGPDEDDKPSSPNAGSLSEGSDSISHFEDSSPQTSTGSLAFKPLDMSSLSQMHEMNQFKQAKSSFAPKAPYPSTNPMMREDPRPNYFQQNMNKNYNNHNNQFNYNSSGMSNNFPRGMTSRNNNNDLFNDTYIPPSQNMRGNHMMNNQNTLNHNQSRYQSNNNQYDNNYYNHNNHMNNKNYSNNMFQQNGPRGYPSSNSNNDLFENNNNQSNYWNEPKNSFVAQDNKTMFSTFNQNSNCSNKLPSNNFGLNKDSSASLYNIQGPEDDYDNFTNHHSNDLLNGFSSSSNDFDSSKNFKLNSTMQHNLFHHDDQFLNSLTASFLSL